jgi:acyl carrier protein
MFPVGGPPRIMEKSMNANSETSAHAETESTLLQIWSEVLNKEQIGVYDDFLSLGGDSLAAMRCVNRIISAFGVEVPLDLFLLESANIAQLTFEIAKMRPNAG